MEKFVRVECIEVEKMTKKEFMKKMLGKEEDSLEEGYLIKDESGHMGWISQSDFEKRNTCPAMRFLIPSPTTCFRKRKPVISECHSGKRM